MKAFILSCFSRPRRLTALIVLLIGSMTPPAVAHRLSAQTITWTSSHPDIVSVNENGTVEMISEPAATTDVTVTATSTQNGKTVTSVKTVQVDACTSCFTWKAPNDSALRTYCGVKLSNGQCWLDRSIGASQLPASATDTQSYGIQVNGNSNAALQCPSGWRLPTSGEWLAAVNITTGKTITASTTYNAVVSDPGTLLNSPLKLQASGYNSYRCSAYNPASNFREYWYAMGDDAATYFTLMIGSGTACKVLCDGEPNVSTVSIRCVKD